MDEKKTNFPVVKSPNFIFPHISNFEELYNYLLKYSNYKKSSSSISVMMGKMNNCLTV